MNCQVCNEGVVEHSRDFCEACRSFYSRNRHREKLPCKQGMFNFKCIGTLSSTRRSVYSRSGGVWRFLCPGCRLKKCRQLKGLEPTNNSNSNDSIANVSIVDDNKATTSLEATVAAIVQGSNRFFNAKSEINDGDCNAETSAEAFQYYHNVAAKFFVILHEFAECLPFYQQTEPALRSKILFDSRVLLLSFESIAKQGEFSVGMFSRRNYQTMMHHFPGMNQMAQDCCDAWNSIQQFNLDQFDKAFVMVHLFCSGNKH